MNADGTEMKKLCDFGYGLQISAEYVYFYSTDEDEFFNDFGWSLDSIIYDLEGSLYRMKKDGSESVLIDEKVMQYVLSDGDCQGMRYVGSIYCSKSTDEGMAVYQMDLNGQNAEEVCYFEDRGEIAVYGGISIVTFTEKRKNHMVLSGEWKNAFPCGFGIYGLLFL